MIDIKVNGQSLDLMPNTSIQIEVSNPMFDLDGIPGALSYPFTIQDTDRNRSLMQYAKVILRRGGEVSLLDCTLYLGGLPFLGGKLYLQKTSDLNYSCYLSADTGDFASTAQSLRLSDLPMGGPRNMGTTEADFVNAMNATTTAGVYPAQDFVFFPIYNNQFGMADEEIVLTIPGFPSLDDYTAICKVQNYWYGGSFWPEWYNYNSGVNYSYNIVWALAFPFVSYILKQIAEVAGYSAIGSYFKDTEMNSLVLNSLQIRPYGSYYQPSGDHSIDLAVGMPEMTLGKFLIGYKNTFCLAIFFDAVAKTMEIVPIKQLLQSQTVEEWTQLAAKGYTIEDRTPPKFKFEFSLDTNDEICSSYVKEITNLPIADQVATITALPLVDPEKTIRFVAAEFAYYQYNKPPVGIVTTPDWGFCSAPFNPKLTDGFTKTITSPFCPIAVFHEVDQLPNETQWQVIGAYPTRVWKVPYIRQNGSFNLKGVFNAKHQPRLMFYRGMHLDNNGDLFPMGSSDNYDMNGVRIADYSLAWDGEDGLYNVWWKDWVNFMQSTRRVTRRVTLGIHELINMDLKTRKRIDGVNYFIEKISITIGMNGIQPADVTFLKG